MILKKYKKSIADYLDVDTNQISLYWRGRVGLYCILKALDIQPGDEVILPAFTCVVVPSAIKYLGAVPIYTSIDPATYNIDVHQIENKITSKTKIILAQNTFGLSSDLDPILEIANKYNLKVIEDCAHGFGGSYKGKKNGTSATAAFFSSQWNKPFSTGIGGIVLWNEKESIHKINAIGKQLSSPTFKDEQMLALQIFIKKNLLTPSIYWNALKLYRWASQKGLISGSSDAGELDSTKMPNGYLKSGAKIQAKVGLNKIGSFKSNLKHRKKLANLYSNAFKQLNISTVFQPEYAVHTFTKYPFLVKNQNQFLELAQKNNIPLGDWMNSPIHPIQDNYHLWDLAIKDFPLEIKIGKHIINLPTDTSISKEEAFRIISFLKKNKSLLISNWQDI